MALGHLGAILAGGRRGAHICLLAFVMVLIIMSGGTVSHFRAATQSFLLAAFMALTSVSPNVKTSALNAVHFSSVIGPCTVIPSQACNMAGQNLFALSRTSKLGSLGAGLAFLILGLLGNTGATIILWSEYPVSKGTVLPEDHPNVGLYILSSLE